MIAPDEGRAQLLDRPPRSLAARRPVGAMLQTSGMPETLRVDELLLLFASYYSKPRPMPELVDLAGIEPVMKQCYDRLSGGQQRRVQFASTLIGRPRALFLDEPTVGLDVEARQAFWSGRFCLISSSASRRSSRRIILARSRRRRSANRLMALFSNMSACWPM